MSVGTVPPIAPSTPSPEGEPLAGPAAPPRLPATPPPPAARITVRGKFLYAQRQKFYVRGVTYGPFRPDESQCEYHDPATVEADFAAMAKQGINTVRTYTVPPRWLLDIAQQHGLRVMVGLPWEQHIAFLDDKKRADSIVQRVRSLVSDIARHPAVLAYTLGNEIPAPIVRWHGPRRVERFIRRLYEAVKAVDPEGLATYVNYPTTEYLDLPFLDFVCFNVYLESREKLAPYLAKLQSHAGDRPLVMGEIGLDSYRNGHTEQARSLEWQIHCAFESGCAGIFVFAWTDEWYRGGAEITDWAFGLVDRQRQPKPALAAVARAYQQSPFPGARRWPRISVLVCTYNGSRTMRDTCEGLRELDYPDFEVIVIDDGSRDNVGDIARGFGFKVIRQPNRGLSSARNTAMDAATGEIVVYLDDDARPDPHWLRYLAHSFMTTDHAAVGGPNFAPPGDGHLADCVANAPGGPIHVLVTDEIAEHIPGCNFAVRRSRLQAVGGFDPQFRIAGDDVDLCWRLQEAGWTIGFSHAAVVWHHRRNSVKAYLKQQLNYGRAEALLERKWPDKYNLVGHIPWRGRLYGKGLLQMVALQRGRIYQGVWGLAPFQSMYQPAPGLLSVLPAMPEWYLIIVTLALLSVMGVLWTPLLMALPLLVVAVAGPIVQAVFGGMNARFNHPHPNRLKNWLKHSLTGFLHVAQPAVRFWGRITYGLHPLRDRCVVPPVMPLTRHYAIWSERWRPVEAYLADLERDLQETGADVRSGGEYENYDLRITSGLMGGARLRVAIEEHGSGKQQVLIRLWPAVSPFATGLVIPFFVLAAFAAANGHWIIAGLTTIIVLLGLFLVYRECGSACNAGIRTILPTKRREESWRPANGHN